jgi:hypothetical protein
MNCASRSAPVNGSCAGSPLLETELELEAPLKPGTAVGVDWLTPPGLVEPAPAALVPDGEDGEAGVDVEALTFPGLPCVMTASVFETAPRPVALTALTRIIGLTIPTLRSSMWQVPEPEPIEMQKSLPL